MARDTPVLSEAEGWYLTLSIIKCVENDITLGEICNTLRGVPAPVRGWGEYVAEGF